MWQFANAHKGMRKNAGSENLSFCQNSTAIFRGRSPSFETERSPAFFERRTVLTICTQSYVESATSVFGKKAILISSFNNFKSTTLVHYTLNQNRLLKINKFNVAFHRVKTDGSSSIQSPPKNPILFERSLTNFSKNSNIPLAVEIHNGE